MRYLFILGVLLTLNVQAQKSGDLEKALGYVSEYNSRYTGGTLYIEEEKEVLQNIQVLLAKLKSYYSSNINSEKVAAYWATTHLYRQAGLVYSYFKDPKDPNWLKEGAKILEEGLQFKNKYYRSAAKAPAEDRVDVNFADSAFIDAAFDAYSSIIATRQKDFKLSLEFLKKLPINSNNLVDYKVPIALAYMEFLIASKSTNGELYNHLYQIFTKTQDWTSFGKLQVEAFIETMITNVVSLKPTMVLNYFGLMNGYDPQPGNLYKMYAVASTQIFKNNQYKFDLRKLQEQLKWADFTNALPSKSDSSIYIKEMINELITTLKNSYPSKPIPKIKGKEDPVREFLDGLILIISSPPANLESLNEAADKHYVAPYSKEAARLVNAINIKW